MSSPWLPADAATYVVCILGTGLLIWWLWRSWQGADDQPDSE